MLITQLLEWLRSLLFGPDDRLATPALPPAPEGPAPYAWGARPVTAPPRPVRPLPGPHGALPPPDWTKWAPRGVMRSNLTPHHRHPAATPALVCTCSGRPKERAQGRATEGER